VECDGWPHPWSTHYAADHVNPGRCLEVERHAHEACDHAGVASITQEDIEAAVRAAWARDTCDPVDAGDWSAANPARGQCGTTALTINDLLGGELMVAEVLRADGTRQGVHWWNRLPDGTEIDLFTRPAVSAGIMSGNGISTYVTPAGLIPCALSQVNQVVELSPGLASAVRAGRSGQAGCCLGVSDERG
jgi:hypothetical protein